MLLAHVTIVLMKRAAQSCDALLARGWFGGQAGRAGHLENSCNKSRMTFK